MCSWRLACMSRCSWVCMHARRGNTQCSRYLSLSAPVVYPLSVGTRCLSFLYFLPSSHRKSVRIVLNVVIVYLVSDHYAHSVYRIVNVKLVYNVKIATKRRCHWILSDRFWRESDTFLKCLQKLLMWCH